VFWVHPPGDAGLARCGVGIALILIAESTKQVIKLLIHLGNPGLTGSSLKWAYRCVVALFVWPSSAPMIGKLAPPETATLAKLWRRSCSRTSSRPAIALIRLQTFGVPS